MNETDAGFEGGLNSSLDPVKIASGGFSYSVNMVNRGGALQTRPGFRTAYKLPSGKLQGIATFYPRRGLPQQVAVVSGKIYVSDFPYVKYRQAPGAELSADSRFAYFCNATQSVTRSTDDFSLTVIAPRNLLMIQDGVASPVYWDGSTVTRLGNSFSTPQGTHMRWVGDRLWVARDGQLFAGDIGDPTSFYEQTYNQLGGLQSFFLPGNITGLASLPGTTAPTLLAFTAETTTAFRADIRTRASWFTTEDFQLTVFPTVGCSAHRSIVTRAGQLSWFSAQGLTSIDSAQFSLHSTRTPVLDYEMIRSKSNLSPDLTGIAGASYDNFVLTSVPEGGKANRHTWVHDASPVANSLGSLNPAWASVWTGINPVQWCNVLIDGREQLFCASADDDGCNRVYQAFTDRQDNGVDIVWSFETRAVAGGTLGMKQLRDVELSLSDILGQLDFKIQWAGPSRGRWKTGGTGKVIASPGSIDATKELTVDSLVFACKKQSRTLRSNDLTIAAADPLGSCGVESPWKETLDRAFMFRVVGSGQCAVRSLRVFMDVEPEPTAGEKSLRETGDRFVRFDGAAAETLEELSADSEVFTAAATDEASYRGFRETGTASVTSPISSDDAKKRAGQLAAARSNHKLTVKALND